MKKTAFFMLIICSFFAHQQIISANAKEPHRMECGISNYANETNGIEKPISIAHVMFHARINKQNLLLEAVIYRPLDGKQHPAMIFTHGRNGPYPSKNTNAYLGYEHVCKYFASEEGLVVIYVIRRGFGNSEGSVMDEYKDTALLSGLEMVKDLSAALDYIKTKDYVVKNQYIIAGHSQGGWAALSSSTVKLEGVACVINFSGATNYAKAPQIPNWQRMVNHDLTQTCRILGKANKIPTLWIYGANEPNQTMDETKEMFNAFVLSGGNAKLMILPGIAHNTTSANAIELWKADVRQLLATNGIATGVQ